MKLEIEKISIDEKDVNELLNNMNDLLEKLTNNNEIDKVLKIIDDFNNLRDHYLTLYWISYIGYLKNVKDEKYLKSEEIFGRCDAVYNNLVYRYFSYLIKLDKINELKNILGNRTFEIAFNQSIFFTNDSSIRELNAKERQLCRQYREIIIGTKFEFENQIVNLTTLTKYLKDNDRRIRKKAYNKRFEILIKLSDKLDNIVRDLLLVRDEYAKTLGFNNYTEYGLKKMTRIGYDTYDLKKFKECVVKFFVPINEYLYKNQQIRLNIKDFSYYDEEILFIDGNASINLSIRDLIKELKTTFKHINSDMYDLFCDMLNNNLIDLEDSENKSSGGITTYLPDYKYPMFIKKYVGLEENLTSIFHEFGHCIQLYYSSNQKYHENRWPTFDICEIHSTSMELLAYPYIKNYFGKDIYKYYIRHLTTLINNIIQMCAADDFQCYLYNNPNCTTDDRNIIWKTLMKKYYPYKQYENEYYDLGISWQTDINRIDNPFYGIDYSLASVCALSFYIRQKSDKRGVISDFLQLCKDGGSISLKDLIAKYDLFNPFDENDLRKISEFIKTDIDYYISKL